MLIHFKSTQDNIIILYLSDIIFNLKYRYAMCFYGPLSFLKVSDKLIIVRSSLDKIKPDLIEGCLVGMKFSRVLCDKRMLSDRGVLH